MNGANWGMLEGRRGQAEKLWRYGLVRESIEVEGVRRESYGVDVIDCRTGERSRRRHVTTSGLDAAALLDLLERGQVSPATLDDVLEDWLGR